MAKRSEAKPKLSSRPPRPDARAIISRLSRFYPGATTELHYRNHFELLVATILSAQSTDVGVNKVTPALFAKYPTAADYAAADRAELEEMIHSTGFFRAKTNSLIGLGQALVERYGGEVPAKLKDLVTLPGITVDTHFGRLSRRFGWTEQDDPVKVEAEVGELFAKRDWTMLSHRVIFHGRRVCHARKPACGACPVARLCPAYGEGELDPVKAAKLVKSPAQVAASP